MRLRWLTVLAVAVFFSGLTPLAAQATTIDDPDDFGGLIDIKEATVTTTNVLSDSLYVLTVEAYEAFDCAALRDSRKTGNALGFAIDFLDTDQTPDLRIRVRCLDTGHYTWRARFVESRLTEDFDTVLRPQRDTLQIIFTVEWFRDFGGTEPARWKVTSARRVDFEPVEIDSAPDQGWSLFDSAAP
jgi:hypothetical protein